MNDIQKLCGAIRQIAWSYVLIHLNIHLGTLNILPDWLGYLLILNALPRLAEAVPSARLLRRPAMLLIAWEAVLWVMALLGASAEIIPLWQIADLVIAAMSLYFHYRLLSDICTLSEQYACPQTARLRHLRTVNTLLLTVLALPLPWKRYEWPVILSACIGLLLTVWIIVELFGLKRELAIEEKLTEEE